MASRRHKVRPLYMGGICFITDRDACPLTCVEMVRMALMSGIRWVQYREKKKDRLSLYRNALALRNLTGDFGAFFIMNDYPDIARAVGADGVHVGQADLPAREARKVISEEMILGVSAHTLEEARRAQQEGADYIGFGPVFDTRTKDAGPARGIGVIRAVTREVDIPVVAIGGIDARSVSRVLASGAQGVAVASGLLSGDLRQNVVDFMSRLEPSGRGGRIGARS
jgi:thiamine-phosphate pyrophosphorylase